MNKKQSILSLARKSSLNFTDLVKMNKNNQNSHKCNFNNMTHTSFIQPYDKEHINTNTNTNINTNTTSPSSARPKGISF